MVISGHLPVDTPIEIGYFPRHRLLPVEVVNRSELLHRMLAREMASRQRADFHQLVVCTGGHGTHDVDFEPVQVAPGTLLRIRPGQVQRFTPEATFEAEMVIWPVESHPADPSAPAWYPGSLAPTRWQLEDHQLAKVRGRVDELRVEQDRFDGSPRHIALMQVLLSSLLLRLAIEIPESSPEAGHLPRPYLDFRELIEQRLHQRPSVAALAQQLGYSSRTLDRACQQVAGRTAKRVLDERLALEVRRLLTHTNRPIARIGADLGFNDPSNFSKFVRRHLGRLPSEIRPGADPTATPDRRDHYGDCR